MFVNPAIRERLRSRQAALEALSIVPDTEGDHLELRQDVNRLYMLTEALWRILKEQHGYSDALLEEKIAEIDYQDGRLDGQVGSKRPAPCPRCQRPCGHNQTVCLYCGQELHQELFG